MSKDHNIGDRVWMMIWTDGGPDIKPGVISKKEPEHFWVDFFDRQYRQRHEWVFDDPLDLIEFAIADCERNLESDPIKFGMALASLESAQEFFEDLRGGAE